MAIGTSCPCFSMFTYRFKLFYWLILTNASWILWFFWTTPSYVHALGAGRLHINEGNLKLFSSHHLRRLRHRCSVRAEEWNCVRRSGEWRFAEGWAQSVGARPRWGPPAKMSNLRSCTTWQAAQPQSGHCIAHHCIAHNMRLGKRFTETTIILLRVVLLSEPLQKQQGVLFWSC